MEEEKQESVQEVAAETAEATAATEPKVDPLADVVRDVEKLATTIGRALILTAEDVTGLMVVKADSEMRHRLDLLVKSGAVKTRSEAANVLLKEGAQAKQTLFEKIDRTQEQIESLRAQLRSLKTIRNG